MKNEGHVRLPGGNGNGNGLEFGSNLNGQNIVRVVWIFFPTATVAAEQARIVQCNRCIGLTFLLSELTMSVLISSIFSIILKKKLLHIFYLNFLQSLKINFKYNIIFMIYISSTYMPMKGHVCFIVFNCSDLMVLDA